MTPTLQSCRLVPSPGLSSSRRLAGTPPTIVATPGRRDRFRCVVVVRAQNAQKPPRQSADQHFVEERERVMRRYADIIDIDHGCLYVEATAISAQLCLSANQALKLASLVMDAAAHPNLDDAPVVEISTSTVHRTLMEYVNIFLDAADASYNRTVTKRTVTSFLGALRGLASISHILLEAALEALSHTHPRDSLSEYAFNCDVKNMRHKFNKRMNDLEDGIRKASVVEICKLAMPAIQEGLKITESFARLMVARRQRALASREDPHPIAMQ